MKDHKKPLEKLFQLALMFDAAEKESLKRANTSQPTSYRLPRKTITRNDKKDRQKKSPCQTPGTDKNHL